jgi:hypothetical protein
MKENNKALLFLQACKQKKSTKAKKRQPVKTAVSGSINN